LKGRAPHPAIFVSVASKGLSWDVSLLFATLTGRSIGVAAKRLKGIVGGDPDSVGATQWKVVDRPVRQRKEPFDVHGKRARIWCHKHREGWHGSSVWLSIKKGMQGMAEI
jgi:hypothetical protein